MEISGERKHRTGWATKVAIWRKRVAQWQRSGLGQAAFCQRQGLAYATFQVWRRRLREDGGHDSAALKNDTAAGSNAFIPVNVRPGVAERPAGSWACELLGPRGVKIRLRRRPSLARLREMVSVLAEMAS